MAERRHRFTFLLKIAATAVLVALFDQLFGGHGIGSAIGGFAGVWLIVVLACRRGVRRSTPAQFAAAAAAVFIAALAYDPSLLALTLFWAALSIVALAPRTAGFDHAAAWALRIGLHGATGPFAAPFDLRRLARVRSGGSARDPRALAGLLALPVLGTALFASLFASANPLIAQAFANVRLPAPWTVILWGMIAAAVWPSLRPARSPTRLVAGIVAPDVRIGGGSLASVLLALASFNLLFALQNTLDIAFLWSGAPLPDGTTLADYAHRGAYPLIATALLAGLFVLVFLHPASGIGRHPIARRLVVLWVAQNIFLVASSALRTVDYIDAYSLTRLRIAALIWMALVATGLALICWRLVAGRSARWLINANALTAAVALTACCFVDLGAVAARWNVRHARVTGGSGPIFDLCYLARLGPSALPALAELERRAMSSRMQDRVRFVRQQAASTAARRQNDWRSWIWADAHRLAAARALLGPAPSPPATLAPQQWRGCDGAIHTPPTPPVVTPLTREAAR